LPGRVATALRASFYIDGFNLYYRALKPNPSVKWLDLDALARALRPGAVVTIRYFTARVTPVPDPGAQGRQKLYLQALGTLPNVSIHYGRFRTDPKSMPLVAPVPGGPRFATVHKTEEKGSDVNLATFLLLDGFDGLYDEAVVISNDTDLREPIAQANARFGRVSVVNPDIVRVGHPTPMSALRQVAASTASLTLPQLRACQLPSPLTLISGRVVTRPPSWI
jgi:hypothetical protein